MRSKVPDGGSSTSQSFFMLRNEAPSPGTRANSSLEIVKKSWLRSMPTPSRSVGKASMAPSAAVPGPEPTSRTVAGAKDGATCLRWESACVTAAKVAGIRQIV